ncbi:ABC transporter permease [Leucobacter soli]|uniref:Inner membrane ABC transporter permease protein YdcV n=1 Tax=Leucobacter soli TaxID=2812850 RepID=A0A916JWP6_9MICO|nr:ABC transporter permease [Leucobacter soli]CAG7606320.1 Inner membrane ABC transporter permease protein YdcV [Leucobacter soli]
MKPRLATRVVGIIFGLLVAAYLILPALAVVPMAFSSGMFLEFPPPGYSMQWIVRFFEDPEWVAALTRSLWVAAATAVVAAPLGTLASYAILTASPRLARINQPLLMLPMMVPVVISGFGLYLVTLLFRVQGGLWLVVLAHIGLALPFVVITVTASLRTFDFRLVRAARVHGATALQTFLKVVVPVIAPGIGAGVLIALMVSLDEAVVALFVAGDYEPTLPVRMFGSITYELNPLVPVAATVLTLSTFLLLGGALLLNTISKRRTGAALKFG